MTSLRVQRSSSDEIANQGVGRTIKRMSGIPSDSKVLQAITGGDVRQVKQWVNSGVLDFNRKITSSGVNALHGAAWCHQVEMMKAMIQAGGNVDIQSDSEGFTALHYMMVGMFKFGYDRAKSAVFTLLNAGCNPNICDNDGWTALHRVVNESNDRDCSQEKIQVIIEVIQMLIDAGTDITIKNKAGKTALDLSERETVSNLLKKKLDEVPQASCRQQLKKQAAEATQAYVKSLPDPPDSVELLLKLTQEQGNREPDIEFVQARGLSAECSSNYDLRMERKNTWSGHFQKSLTTALSSVALLSWSSGLCGTAFRVGTRYMITNCHVVKEPLPGSAEEVVQRQARRWAQFNYDRHPLNPADDIFSLKFTPYPVVWYDEDLDIAILELAPPHQQTRPIPPPLVNFVKVANDMEVNFMGHPGAEHKHVDVKCSIVQDDFVRRANELATWSIATYGINHYSKLTDPRCVSYQVSVGFLKGASGSPGFVNGPHDEACVSVVHTRAYPVPVGTEPPPPSENTVEQGVRIEAVFEQLQRQNPALCQDIFIYGRPR